MSALLEAALQVHLLLTLLRLLQTFLSGLLPIGFGISVHDTHVVNTVFPILPEVLYQKVSLLFRGLWRSVIGSVVSLVLAGLAFVLFTAQPW